MSWNLREVKKLVERYHPGGQAWEAEIREGDWDIRVNDEPGCQDVLGTAVDQNSDGLVDLFLYERDFLDPVAVTSKNLDRYVQLPICAEPPPGSVRCDQRPGDLRFVGFPFQGGLLPDSVGKITSIMFASNPMTIEPVRQLLAERQDLQCQILLNSGSSMEIDFPSASLCSSGMHISSYTPPDCDFHPCAGGLWVQDELFVGINDRGELVASAYTERGMKLYVSPLVKTLAAVPYRTDEYLHGGGVLSSSTYIFVPKRRGFLPGDNFLEVFAHGRKLVEVDGGGVPSAAHLDMILTPTEETQNGKPVVMVAKGVPPGSEPAEQKALETVAANLETQGFFVERLPYLYTGASNFGIFRTAVAYSYNNVLLERYREGDRLIKRVYLPWYAGHPDANREAGAVFHRYGFEVIPITGLEQAGENGGSIRCFVKVTNRSF